ncbi:MAG TPA: hypothetical protein VNK03_05865 [Gammaproteobacteria bacterium]|nr:hypothetical protein [Gammaproteobacteria bacterium]
MPKVTVFLDVDETCVISNALYGQKDGGYRYNDVLFAALKNCQCTELYLLTSFDLASVSRNLQDEVVATPSRLKLIQYLEQQGFKVQGVITSLDVVFKQGIGAYYEKVIKPYEMRVVEGEDFRIGNAAQAYQADCEKEKSLVEKAHITGLKVGDKGGLYRYFIEVQRNVLLYSTFKVIFVDDRPGYLTDIKNANQEYGYPLCLIQAKPQDTSSYYQKLLSDFQYDLEREYVTQQLERIKALTLDKTQDEAYQTLQKEFKQIFSIPPDLLDLRNLSMKMTYFLTQLENSKNFYSKAQDALFDNPLLQDKHAERLIADIKAMPGVTELLDTSQPEATLYGLEKPYGISLKTARDMLHRINKTGNSHVGRVGNVFFKQDPKYSLVEQAIYQLSRLFGEGAVTPTRLLLLEIPNDQTYALQASLGVGVDGNIDAIDLDALCQIPETIAMLKQDVGEALLVQDFERLLTNDYYQTWLSKRGFNVDMSLEKQCTVLLESLLKLPQDCWPVGLKEFYDQPEAQKSKLLHAALQEAFQDDKRAPLRLLALLERYPALSKHPLNHLIACSDVFECLRFLYPSLSAKAVLKETESLFKYIDKANLSIHLLLEMVSDPQDHKGDNFKAQFRRNSDGNLIAPLEIIAIDNDDAMKGTFKSKKGEHLLLVKSLLLANSALLNESIAESVRERCLLIHPKVAMMQWLESLNQYYEPYYALKERGIIFKGLSQALLLEEQVPVDFIGRLLERLEVIQNSLKQGTITHKILWHQVEPLLAYSYEALSRQSPGSEALMTALYHKKKPVFLGNVLKADLAKTLDSGKTLSDLIAAESVH